jgi:hypothetical protein
MVTRENQANKEAEKVKYVRYIDIGRLGKNP